MTEKEFREGLNKCLAGAGLSAGRRSCIIQEALNPKHQNGQRLLRPLVVSLLLVIILSLAAVGAAGMLQYIGWNGEVAKMPMIMSVPEDMQGMQRGLAGAKDGLLTVVGQKSSGRNRTVRNDCLERYTRLDELEKAVRSQRRLPWPVKIHEGYELFRGHVKYDCRWPGEYELVSSTVDENGYVVLEFSIPERYRILSGYRLELQGSEAYLLIVDVMLNPGLGDNRFTVTDADTVEVLMLEGMSDAVYISSQEENRLYLQKLLPERISVSGPFMAESTIEHGVSHYGSIYFRITTNDPLLGKAELLQLFGLTEKQE